MTVAELIEKLRTFPGDRRVVVPGYEYGVDDIEDPVVVNVERIAEDQRWIGPHVIAREGGEPAVLIVDKRNGRRAYTR